LSASEPSPQAVTAPIERATAPMRQRDEREGVRRRVDMGQGRNGKAPKLFSSGYRRLLQAGTRESERLAIATV
jgi:hypothetical protein